MNIVTTIIGDAAKQLNRYWINRMGSTHDVAINRIAPRLEAYAKQNAPWEDRTGLARASLWAKYTRLGRSQFKVELGHGSQVYYGYYLETMQSGRFSILKPTMIAMFPENLDDIVEVWRRR